MNKPQPCKRCGSTVTVQMEGKLFCSRCNEQIEEFFEVESEDEGANVTIYSRIKTPKARETEDVVCGDDDDDLTTAEPGWKTTRQPKVKKETRLLDEDDLNRDYVKSMENMEVFSDKNVGGSATRIGSFCKILYKISTMMTVELGFPDTYRETVKCITQMYLQKCGAAFVEKEYTEDPAKMFKKTTITKRSKSKVSANIKRLKLQKKKKGISKLEKSVDAWNLLQDTNMTENFELSSDEGASTMKMDITAREVINVVETNIDTSIKEKAETCYLSVDAIVAILFVSSMRAGCLWVTLSDIIRWIREDRGKIFGNLFRLNPSGRSVSYNTSSDPLASLILPLSEFCRVKYWVWQIVDVDTSSLTIPYPQIVARYLYNLNLPTDMMQRVLILMDCAPPSEQLDNVYITQQGDSNDSLFMPDVNRSVRSCFGKFNEKRLSNNFDAFISTDTKILAYILLALKLVYGLDGKNEYSIKQNCFDPVEWTYQLRMRSMLFEGHAVKDVINETKINYPLTTLRSVFDEYAAIRCIEGLTVQFSRAQMFPTVMPSVTPCDSAFDEVNPLIDDITDRTTNRNDEDKVYAPIRAQVLTAKQFFDENRSEEQQIKISEKISAEAYEILTTDYGEKRIRVSNDANPSAKEDTSGKRSGKWRKLFPSSMSYIKYPTPEWTQGMIVHLPETNRIYRRINKTFEDQNVALVGPRSMFLSAAGSSDLYHTAFHTFSPIFTELLELLSKSICEHHHILYAAFIMIEMQIVDRASYTENSRKILEQETVPLSYIIKTKTNAPIKCGSVIVSVEKPIKELRELRILRFGAPREWISGICDENNSDSEFEDSFTSDAKILRTGNDCNLDHLENIADCENNEASYLHSNVFGHLYDWTTFWQLLTMRYW